MIDDLLSLVVVVVVFYFLVHSWKVILSSCARAVFRCDSFIRDIRNAAAV